MKILYFSRDYTTHDHRFLTALCQAGHLVFYLRLERRGHALEDRALPPEVQQVAWAGGQKPFSLRDTLRLAWSLRGVLSQIEPDLALAGPLQTAAWLVALTGFRPLVSMSWGYDLLIDAQRGPFWRLATRFTLGRSAAMVGDCATIRQKAILFGMPDERIVTFPWGIDLSHFSPAPGGLGGPAAPFTLLSARGWEPVYGAEVIARAFVKAARQTPNLRIMMLGNGSQAGLLRKIFIDGDVADQVLFPGQVSQADLPRFYRQSDLYVCASHSDGTSISLLEALACGKPALISDIPGHREWVTPDVEGWWFPDGDADALAQGIIRAFEQRRRLPAMGRAARRLAESRADWNKNFPVLFKAFDIALAK